MEKNNDISKSKFAVMANNIEYIKKEIEEIKEDMKEGYITRQEFDPVKKLVYGLVTLLLTGVIIAVINLVIIK